MPTMVQNAKSEKRGAKHKKSDAKYHTIHFLFFAFVMELITQELLTSSFSQGQLIQLHIVTLLNNSSLSCKFMKDIVICNKTVQRPIQRITQRHSFLNWLSDHSASVASTVAGFVSSRFFLWAHLKDKVFKTLSNNLDQLKQQIEEE